MRPGSLPAGQCSAFSEYESGEFIRVPNWTDLLSKTCAPGRIAGSVSAIAH